MANHNNPFGELDDKALGDVVERLTLKQTQSMLKTAKQTRPRFLLLLQAKAAQAQASLQELMDYSKPMAQLVSTEPPPRSGVFVERPQQSAAIPGLLPSGSVQWNTYNPTQSTDVRRRIRDSSVYAFHDKRCCVQIIVVYGTPESGNYPELIDMQLWDVLPSHACVKAALSIAVRLGDSAAGGYKFWEGDARKAYKPLSLQELGMMKTHLTVRHSGRARHYEDLRLADMALGVMSGSLDPRIPPPPRPLPPPPQAAPATTQGGAASTGKVKHRHSNGRLYTLHTGPRGGRYIMVQGTRVRIARTIS